MRARAISWINLAVSAVVVSLVVRWRLRFAFDPSAINPVVEAVATHLPHFARCPSVTKTVEVPAHISPRSERATRRSERLARRRGRHPHVQLSPG
jgi:hypothetical protein